MNIDEPEDTLFNIEKFVDSRWFGIGPDRVVKYRVRWLGYKPADDTWQSIEETGWPPIMDILQAYNSFHDAYPRKATDARVTEAIMAKCLNN